MENNENLINEIKRALKLKTELENLEFKLFSNDVQKEFWKSVSAFANKKNGGYVICGVDEKDDFKIKGCTGVDKIQQKIIEICSDKMNYIVRPKISVLDFEGVVIVCVYVSQAEKENMPCYFKPVGPFGGSYIRIGNSSRKMNDEEVKNFLMNSKEFKYDKTQAIGVNMENLDNEKITSFLKKQDEKIKRELNTIEINNHILKNIGIIDLYEDKFEPTLAGALIFSKFLPDANPYNRFSINCIKYIGDDPSSDVLDTTIITGTLENHIDKVFEFILKHTKKGFDIEGVKRVDRYEYPIKAIRELVANAVIHRDYKITGTFTQIRIFKNRIEIVSPGSLPPGISIENIKDSQFSRNENIASILKDLDYLEEFGRGIDVVYSEMKNNNLPDPIFKNQTNTFEAILLGDRYRDINERQLKIINLLLLKNRITMEDCKITLEGTPDSTVKSDIRKMKDSGLIIQKGASVSTYYILAI